MSVNILTPHAGRSIGAMLCRVVREYFQDENHRREFEKWYEQKYGKPYVFKTQEENKT